jgi:hypothetical protein
MSTKVAYTRLEQLHWNIYTDGAHKNDNDNITLIFIGLAKHKKHGRRKKKVAQENIKVLCSLLKQMYFNVNDENAVTWEYCEIFVQSKNCGTNETAVASERLLNNIRF